MIAPKLNPWGLSLFMATSRMYKMAEMRYEGMTYREIGDRFGLSNQRVHKIIGKYIFLEPKKAKVVEKTCPRCDKKFSTKVFDSNYGNKYCSQKCVSKGHICRCGNKIEALTSSKCRPCGAKYSRKYRRTEKGKKIVNEIRKKQYDKFKVKSKARAVMNYHLNLGNLSKPNNCMSCKEVKKLDGHHKDYSKPLKVIWLCRVCHLQEHRKTI